GNYSFISVEHILPQNPPNGSRWREWFTDEEIEQYKHKMGNLVLLNRRRNSSLSNLDFDKKKERYFKGSMSTFPSINNIMHKTEWRKEDIENRTNNMLKSIEL
ncbi:HNH endonuclease, partial [bacterium]|nr:HNH endonuclease [bacterium]